MTPGLCRRVRALGAEVVVESGAGRAAGFSDAEYQQAGAAVVHSAGEVWFGGP